MVEERWCPRVIALERGARDLGTLPRELFFAAEAGPIRAAPFGNNFVDPVGG